MLLKVSSAKMAALLSCGNEHLFVIIYLLLSSLILTTLLIWTRVIWQIGMPCDRCANLLLDELLVEILTHWSRNKMHLFGLKFHWFFFHGLARIASDNGLVPCRRQAIIMAYSCSQLSASLDLDEVSCICNSYHITPWCWNSLIFENQIWIHESMNPISEACWLDSRWRTVMEKCQRRKLQTICFINSQPMILP